MGKFRAVLGRGTEVRSGRWRQGVAAPFGFGMIRVDSRAARVVTLVLAGSWGATALADGTEALGAPGIAVAKGSDLIVAGVGLVAAQPSVLNVTVPSGSSIVQVLAYWEGIATTADEQGETDTVTVDDKSVTGMRIGGPTQITGSNFTSTYRADVTNLDLLADGANTLVVGGLDFTQLNDGFGLVIVVDDGSGARALELRDGNDYAFEDFAAPLNDTVLQTFAFEAATEERDIDLSIMVGHVGATRASTVEVWVDGALSEELYDVLGNTAGPEWDVLEHSVTVPAGATSVGIRPVSRDSGLGPKAGQGTASVTWLLATAVVEDAPVSSADQGCDPFLWSLNTDLWDGVDDDATTTIRFQMNFNRVMNVNRVRSGMRDDLNLLDAMWLGGGWFPEHTLLNRHAATALANADSGLAYPYTVDEVISIYRDAVRAQPGPESVLSALLKFARANRMECPLDE